MGAVLNALYEASVVIPAAIIGLVAGIISVVIEQVRR